MSEGHCECEAKGQGDEAGEESRARSCHAVTHVKAMGSYDRF